MPPALLRYLVVAYALAGDLNIDLSSEPLGVSKDGPYKADHYRY